MIDTPMVDTILKQTKKLNSCKYQQDLCKISIKWVHLFLSVSTINRQTDITWFYSFRDRFKVGYQGNV